MKFYQDRKGQVLYILEYKPSKHIFIKCLGSFPDDTKINNSLIVEDEITPEYLNSCKKISKEKASKINPFLVNTVKALYLD